MHDSNLLDGYPAVRISSLRQDDELGLAAAAHAVYRAGIESACIVLVAAGSIRLHSDLFVGAADDRIVGFKRIVCAERDHETSVLVGGHPHYWGPLLDTEELITFGIGYAGLHARGTA